MLGSNLTAISEEASRRYGHVLTAFRGIFAGVLNSAHPFGATTRTGAVTQAYQVARDYLDSERDLIAGVTDDIALGALQSAQSDLGLRGVAQTIPTDLGELLSASVSGLHHEVAIQLERDIQTMRLGIDRMVFEVTRQARAGGMSKEAALIRWKIARPSDVQFYFRDRGGRRLASQKHTKIIWRDHLLATHNDAYLFALADAGETMAMVTHPDPKHRFHGLVFTLGGEGEGMPSFLDICDEVFHPNSDAVVSRLSKD